MKLDVIKNYLSIQEVIDNSLNKVGNVKIISVTKTFEMNSILPLIDHGVLHYGENKVQEALTKWLDVKKKNPKIKLHMLGKLQTNKVKKAVNLFDYIHSLDNIKLAQMLCEQEKKTSKKLKYFIQVNVSNEVGKSGISLKELDSFYNDCKIKYNLNIVGLMCIPPINENHSIIFQKLSDLNKKYDLSELSMGMSNDYKDALRYGATFIRIGSAIFGKRS